MRALGPLLAVALLAGCAAQPTATDAAPASSAASSASASVAPSVAPSPEPSISLPTGVPKTKRPEHPTDDFPVVTVEGRIVVDGRCVDLVTDKVTWTLLGPEGDKLRDGQKVRVVGVPNPNAFTACTGSPLTVQRATPL